MLLYDDTLVSFEIKYLVMYNRGKVLSQHSYHGSGSTVNGFDAVWMRFIWILSNWGSSSLFLFLTVTLFKFVSLTDNLHKIIWQGGSLL